MAIGEPSELGGLIVQRGASTVLTWIDPEVAAQGVVLSSLERGGHRAPRARGALVHEASERGRRQVRRGHRGVLDRRRVRVGPERRESREAAPDRLPDRRTRGRAVRAHPRRGRRAGRVPHPRVRPRARLRGPGPALRCVRALLRRGIAGQARPLPELGRRRGPRHLDQEGRDRPRRAVHLDADPPRRAPDQAAARHHHRRDRLGHAPQGDLPDRGDRAPRPLHHRPQGRAPHQRRHGVEGSAHGLLASVLRGPDPDRAAARRSRTRTCRRTRCCSRPRPRATPSPR